MRVVGLDADAMVNYDQLAVLAAPFGVQHDAVAGGADGRSLRYGDVEAGVEGSFAGERIGTLAEVAHQLALDGPNAGEEGRLEERIGTVGVAGDLCALE